MNSRGDLDVIRLLIARGADVNALNHDGYTPLLLALRHAHYNHSDPRRLLAVVDLLLVRGASVAIAGKDGALPLRAAMDPTNLPLIQLLIKHGSVMPDDGLVWAMSNKHVELVKMLLASPTPGLLSYRDARGGSMLYRAAEVPQLLFALEWFVRNGSDIHAGDDDGITPLGRASHTGNISAMAYLHRFKANATQASRHGQAPLHLAAYGARHDVMAWLIERGADPKARDQRGRTPLDIAIDTHPFAFYDEGSKQRLVTMLGGTQAD